MIYVNQKNEIKDFEFNGKTAHGVDCCGASCGSMVTGKPPQEVAEALGPSVSDDKIIKFIEAEGWKSRKISDGGTESTAWGYVPTEKDFASMKVALDEGKIILYHFAGWDKKSSGHYVICTGYESDGFIFSDPAGDRKRGYFGKGNEGEAVKYSKDMLIKAGIKRLFSLE